MSLIFAAVSIDGLVWGIGGGGPGNGPSRAFEDAIAHDATHAFLSHQAKAIPLSLREAKAFATAFLVKKGPIPLSALHALAP